MTPNNAAPEHQDTSLNTEQSAAALRTLTETILTNMELVSAQFAVLNDQFRKMNDLLARAPESLCEAEEAETANNGNKGGKKRAAERATYARIQTEEETK